MQLKRLNQRLNPQARARRQERINARRTGTQVTQAKDQTNVRITLDVPISYKELEYAKVVKGGKQKREMVDVLGLFKGMK